MAATVRWYVSGFTFEVARPDRLDETYTVWRQSLLKKKKKGQQVWWLVPPAY